MNPHERVKQFAEKHGATLTTPTQKEQLKSQLKGKTDKLTPKEKDDLLLQIAHDLGYID